VHDVENAMVRLILILAALMVLVPVAAKTTFAGQCRPKLSVISKPNHDLNAAKLIAKRRWSLEAAELYGMAYADWKKADIKSMDCNNDGRGSPWRCTARATPCLS
jgi:hypothetical protein